MKENKIIEAIKFAISKFPKEEVLSGIFYGTMDDIVENNLEGEEIEDGLDLIQETHPEECRFEEDIGYLIERFLRHLLNICKDDKKMIKKYRIPEVDCKEIISEVIKERTIDYFAWSHLFSSLNNLGIIASGTSNNLTKYYQEKESNLTKKFEEYVIEYLGHPLRTNTNKLKYTTTEEAKLEIIDEILTGTGTCAFSSGGSEDFPIKKFNPEVWSKIEKIAEDLKKK